MGSLKEAAILPIAQLPLPVSDLADTAPCCQPAPPRDLPQQRHIDLSADMFENHCCSSTLLQPTARASPSPSPAGAPLTCINKGLVHLLLVAHHGGQSIDALDGDVLLGIETGLSTYAGEGGRVGVKAGVG